MTYTPAQISASYGGDVFTLDYPHSNLAQTFSFTSGAWGLYQATNVAVGETVTPNADSTGTSVAGNITFSVTLWHLATFTSSHVEWDGDGVTVEYTLDGTTWTALSANDVIPLNKASNPDLDLRVSFAGGVSGDTSALRSLTVYVLTDGTTKSASGARTLTFGTDPLTSDGWVTTSGTISAAATVATLPDGSPATGAAPVEVGSIEIYAAVGSLDTPIVSGTGFSFSTNSGGGPVATGCTVYINGVVSTSAPLLVEGSVPYHFLIIPNTPANEEFTIGTGLTISDLALYNAVLTSADAFDIYSSIINGFPTLSVSDSGVITVTELDPAVDIYAYAWSIVSVTTT